MKRLMSELRSLFGLEREERKWWDEDPINVIQGPALAEALRRARHGGRAAA